MPLSDTLASWLGALFDVAGSLWGAPSKGFVEADGADAFAPSGPTSHVQLSKITQQDLDRWFAALGDALTVRADESVSGAAWEADVTDHDVAGLKTFLAEADRLQAPQITAGLTVDKALLSRRIEPAMPGVEPRLRILPFFFAAGLSQALSKADPEDPESFKKDFLSLQGGPPVDRLLLLVADAPGRLLGPWLSVLGNPDCDAFTGFAPPAATAPDPGEVLKLLRDLRGGEGPARLGITPDLLELAECRGLDDVARQLTRLQNRLVVPFLANRTGDKPDELVFESSRTAIVALGDEPASRHLYGLYRWVFEEPKSARTKLEIARRVIASHLLADTPAENFRELVRLSPRILEESKLQLRLLTDGNIAASFDRRQKMEDAVGKYVDDAGQRIQALGKEVVDNIYKTAGLLVGVVIAYILKPDQGPGVLLVTGALYAGYILFILFFYLPSIRSELELRKGNFHRRLAEDEKLRALPAGLIREQTEKARAQEERFERTYRTVRGFYWLFIVIVALLVAGWFVRRELAPDPGQGSAHMGSIQNHMGAVRRPHGACSGPHGSHPAAEWSPSDFRWSPFVGRMEPIQLWMGPIRRRNGAHSITNGVHPAAEPVPFEVEWSPFRERMEPIRLRMEPIRRSNRSHPVSERAHSAAEPVHAARGWLHPAAGPVPSGHGEAPSGAGPPPFRFGAAPCDGPTGPFRSRPVSRQPSGISTTIFPNTPPRSRSA